MGTQKVVTTGLEDDISTGVNIPKSIRLLNLVAALLFARQFLTVDQIRYSVSGYDQSGSRDTFLRMFERDKERLRELGIPIEIGQSHEGTHETGYRINVLDYMIGDIHCDSEEVAVLAMAAALWKSPDQRKYAHKALIKLRSSGININIDEIDEKIDIDLRRTALFLSGIGSEENLSVILEAIHNRKRISFRYPVIGTSDSAIRIVEPWTISINARNWYIIGYDIGKEAKRTFKLLRIIDQVQLLKQDALYPINLSDITDGNSHITDECSDVRLWIKDSCAHGLIRVLEQENGQYSSVPFIWQGESGEMWTVRGVNEEILIPAILAQGSNVAVCRPESLQGKIKELLHVICDLHK